jgi:hypothetical protein
MEQRRAMPQAQAIGAAARRLPRLGRRVYQGCASTMRAPDRSPRDPADPARLSLEYAGGALALAVRRSARARRITLRVDPRSAEVELVLPRRASLASGQRFALERRQWIAARLAAIPARVAFSDGARIPFLGEMLTIRHRPERRGAVRREGGEIVVSGQPAHTARRVGDWLKGEARRIVALRARDFAERLDKPIVALRLGDARTRWGSCSADGTLAFSWRLVLAPPEVLDYVVAHEVAHLSVLNHGRRFWRTVERLMADWRPARAWLAANGVGLLRYG